ncbi:F-box/LRR-repeat protein At4g14103-like [Neltuma alba]|uniref:F-box/LRR-repeat protein At4g14103-like n=1 Tax=Neltuma alba TaxID=207710 RepID=UPI0010A5843A|nr:F-box/LRR-repeat protein At4g14103-like [Prosopis alba]
MGVTCLRREAKLLQQDMNRSFRIGSLSELDDDVLLHILSFLPFKEAIQTSILCKRWQYLWTPISILDFTQTTESAEDFMNFIGRTLSLRGSSKIAKFKLVGRMNALLPVEALVSVAARCNVEDCELHLKHLEVPLFFPHSLHNLATLTHVHIERAHQRLIVHPSICLPNLKTLKLCDAVFFEEQLTQALFSGCPVLETLHAEDCFWEGVTTVSKPPAKLQRLIIDEPMYQNPYNPVVADEFVIHGDGLRQFNSTGHFYFDYRILNSALLEELTVEGNLPNTHRRSVSECRF